MHRCLAAILLAAAIALPAAGQTGNRVSPPERSPSPEQIRRWMEQLDHDDYTQRERAGTALVHAGAAAIAPLADGVLSSNPEIAWRASDILERMALEGDEALLDRVVNVLQDLARRGKPGLGTIAGQMKQRQVTFRHNRAASELRKLGAHVPNMGPGAEDDVEEELTAELMVPLDVGIADLDLDIDPFEEPGVDDVEGMEMVEAPPAEIRGIGAAIAERLLPGPVGAALRRALGLPEADAIKVGEIALGMGEGIDDEPLDFSLPRLDEDDFDDWSDRIAMEEIFPGDDMVEDEPAMEAMVEADVEFGDIAAPIMIGGGLVTVDSGFGSSVITLTREWRGGDAALKHLKDLSGITSLQIEHADLTDAALPAIAKMASLRHLQIRGGKFSAEALRAFHKERENVSIMALGEGMMGVNGPFDAGACRLDTVFPGSAAHDAGLRPGDKIISIAGTPIADFSELTIAVSTRKPGEKLEVKYVREGEERSTEVTLKQRGPGQ
jgi:hypothetical protein